MSAPPLYRAAIAAAEALRALRRHATPFGLPVPGLSPETEQRRTDARAGCEALSSALEAAGRETEAALWYGVSRSLHVAVASDLDACEDEARKVADEARDPDGHKGASREAE